MPIAIFILGLVALIAGAELFLKGVDHFGVKWRISPLIMGLTVVAFATGAPELAVSLQAALNGSADLVLGNIIGSNIANILLILGISALIKPIAITMRLVRIDVPMVIAASILLYVISLDGVLDLMDGVYLVMGLLGYSIFTFFQIKKERDKNELEQEVEELAETLSSGWFFYVKNVGFLVIGLTLIVIGSGWMVDGAVEIARLLGLSELLIGLTIVSIGTSLPEVATSIATIRKGNADMAVANVLGSNLYNILLTLGVTLIVAPNVLDVSSDVINIDLPFMLLVSVACIPIFIAGMNLVLTDGLIFLTYYFGYILFLVLDAVDSPFQGGMEKVMFWFIFPSTIIYMIVRIFIHRNQIKKMVGI